MRRCAHPLFQGGKTILETTNTTNAVAYLRYSSANQADGQSIEYQRDAIRRYAASHNLQIVNEYVDEARTGTNDKRPGFQRMIADAKQFPHWTSVLIFDLSRFSRNATDASVYMGVLEDHGITLISVTQELGSGTEGWLTQYLLNGINEFYSRNLAKHTHAGMTEIAKAGKHNGGTPPLGYLVNPKGELEIEPEKAKTVQKIFDLFDLGYSYQKMADILNQEGHTTGAGQPFTKNSFNHILTQRKYTGTMTWNKAKAKKSDGKRNSHALKPGNQWITVPNAFPPIIDQAQFDRVQEKMSTRAKGQSDSKARRHYMLGGLGLMKCAECGNNMVGATTTSHGKDYVFYRCPKHRGLICPTKDIPASKVEHFVASALVSNAFTSVDLNQLSKQLNATGSSYKKLHKRLREIEKERMEITKAIRKGCSEALTNELHRLDIEKADVEKQIQAVTGSSVKIDKQNKHEIVKQFRKYLKNSDDPEARAYIKEHIKEIVVSNDEVAVTVNVV